MRNLKTLAMGAALATSLICSSGVAQVQGIEPRDELSLAKVSPAAGASSGERPVEAGVTSMAALDGERKLMIADVLSFQILEDGEPAKRMIVTDSAEVDVPYIGRIKAEGRTCKDLAAEVKRRLEKDFYHKATVIIGLDYNAYGTRNPGGRGGVGRNGRGIAATGAKEGYTMMGQVANPGVFPLRADLEFKLSHAILQSGGFQKFANNRRVRVLRKNSAGNLETIVVNLRDVMDKGRLEKDIILQKGDVVIVDKKLFNF